MRGLSIVVPVRDGAAHLGAALASLPADAGEVIVVDDGSTDGSRAVAEGAGGNVRVIESTARGASGARNTGIRAARGEVIGFCDADDAWAPGPDPRWARLAAAPGLDVVLGALRWTTPDGTEAIGPPFASFSLPAALIRRRAFGRAGLLDETMDQGEDVDWFLRAREAGLGIETLLGVTLEYRRRPGSLTTSDAAERDRWFVTALRKSIERRRAAG